MNCIKISLHLNRAMEKSPKLILKKDHFKILLSATAFQTEGKKFKLVAFQNINEALDETESKAWQKLLSVMTHEIMNSVAPISSLADTLKNRLEKSMSHHDHTNRRLFMILSWELKLLKEEVKVF